MPKELCPNVAWFVRFSSSSTTYPPFVLLFLFSRDNGRGRGDGGGMFPRVDAEPDPVVDGAREFF